MDLFPRSSPRPTESHAERAVYDGLAKTQLPGWRAWHSLRLRVGSGWEGEGDFVLANPDRGLLVLEVKGGSIELRDGRWLQNGKDLLKAPRDQGLGFVRHLIAALKARQIEAPPFGVGTAFPDCEFSSGPDSGDLQGLVVGHRDLAYLSSALPSLMQKALPDYAVPRNKRWLEEIHRLWGETWVPNVRLADRVEDQAARCIPLDAQQLGLLDMAEGVQRAVVEGGAGTGKTLVAAEACRRRVQVGRTALYLSFTDALAQTVEAQFAAEFVNTERRPRAHAIRQFARGLLAKAGQPVVTPGPDFWDEVSLQAACDALPAPEDRPDLVVVDEAQDFEASDWALVEQLVGDKGLWVFRDAAQAFWSDRPLPEALLKSAAPLKLLKQYRCPGGLWQFASAYRDASAPLPGKRPEAQELRAVVVPEAEVLDRVRHELDVLRKEGVGAKDIAILSLSGKARSRLFGLEKLGQHRVAHADSVDAGENVVVDTFLRFKGLERPFLIVTELAGPHVTNYETRMHIALTRATVGAVVVADEVTARTDPRLAWLVAK